MTTTCAALSTDTRRLSARRLLSKNPASRRLDTVPFDRSELRVQVAAHQVGDCWMLEKCVLSVEVLVFDEKFQNVASQFSRQVEHPLQAVISRIDEVGGRRWTSVFILRHGTRFGTSTLAQIHCGIRVEQKLMEGYDGV